jgi:amidohydrolase
MDVTESPRLSPLAAGIDSLSKELEPALIAFRRDLHSHPELGNREFRTSKKVAEHLSSLGLEVRTGIAHTGVVGVLRGGKPGPVVALRADMDALPVAEEVDLPFASKVRTEYGGETVGVMHACGHDCHTAILMVVAEIFVRLRDELRGTVKFIFQPAEEGAPEGEEGGAKLMIEQGVLEDPAPEAIFGLHVTSLLNTGVIGYKAGPTMASADNFHITVHGRQTHGGMPWLGVDPIVTAAHVILGLQSVVSRQLDPTREPSVVTLGVVRGGVRENIIPDSVEMKGTIRTFAEDLRDDLHERVKATAEGISCACRAHATVSVKRGYPVTVNDPKLTEWSLPTLSGIVGPGLIQVPKFTGAEDFSYFQQRIPGFFYFVGVTPRDRDARQAPPNHSPHFYVDESALIVGVRSLARLAADYFAAHAA